MHLFRARSLVVLGVSLFLSGCLDSVIPPHNAAGGSGGNGGSSTMDETALSAMLSAGAYRDNSFVQMNPTTPFISSLDGTHIKMYVSQDAAAAYKAVTPDTTTAGDPFPVGGIVVREASDANGKLMAITTMVKREAGYFPEVGDFFFGVLDPSGNPVSEGGVLEWGKVEMCAGCHEPRQSSGFLFGVATSNRK